MPLFDSYIIVDWSASNRPKRGKDSIWIGACGGVETLENPRTRTAAMERVEQIVRGELAAGRRSLVGFDFALGYPRGTSRALGLDGTAWRSTWRMLREAIEDDGRNRSNRFEVAAGLNVRISGGRGPFWGCPRSRELALLGPRKVDASDGGLPEFRIGDGWTSGPHSVWKLYAAGAVGSQVLVGIPRIAAFRRSLEGEAVVWPFETGLRAPGDARVVIAEVYPTLAKFEPEAGRVKDAQQVESLAKLLAEWDRAGILGDYFAGPKELTSAQRAAIEEEEGWILGVLRKKAATSRSRPAARRGGSRHVSHPDR